MSQMHPASDLPETRTVLYNRYVVVIRETDGERLYEHREGFNTRSVHSAYQYDEPAYAITRVRVVLAHYGPCAGYVRVTYYTDGTHDTSDTIAVSATPAASEERPAPTMTAANTPEQPQQRAAMLHYTLEAEEMKYISDPKYKTTRAAVSAAMDKLGQSSGTTRVQVWHGPEVVRSFYHIADRPEIARGEFKPATAQDAENAYRILPGARAAHPDPLYLAVSQLMQIEMQERTAATLRAKLVSEHGPRLIDRLRMTWTDDELREAGMIY